MEREGPPVESAFEGNAAARPTIWLSGGGGIGKTPSQLCSASGKTRLCASGEVAVRLEPVLGGNP
jgi:hypothetical protein